VLSHHKKSGISSVFDEVRYRSLPLYNQLRALSEADDKAVFVFYNEFRAYASHLAQPHARRGASSGLAASWYASFLLTYWSALYFPLFRHFASSLLPCSFHEKL
jgi:hypothetical protein